MQGPSKPKGEIGWISKLSCKNEESINSKLSFPKSQFGSSAPSGLSVVVVVVVGSGVVVVSDGSVGVGVVVGAAVVVVVVVVATVVVGSNSSGRSGLNVPPVHDCTEAVASVMSR